MLSKEHCTNTHTNTKRGLLFLSNLILKILISHVAFNSHGGYI